MRDLGANTFSVGALAEKGVKTDLLSSPPALSSRNLASDVQYVVFIILPDVDLDLPISPLVFRADADAGVWQRRMGHCNAP